MQYSLIQRILGLLLMSFSVTLIPPMLVSLWYKDNNLHAFTISFLVMFALGLVSWLPARHVKKELYLHDGFIVTSLFWIVLSVVSAVPFLITPHLNLAQSVFEAVSGFTTTGATVMSGLDHLPPSILYYRQQLQWIGGLGVIVFAVAVLPMLGIGGMQLYRAETPGPMHDDKITPRLQHTVWRFLLTYLVITVACTLAFWAAGMSLFDAIAHSYSTVSTGGFSTHDDSLKYFNSVLIEVIAIVFMLLGSLSFTLHYMSWAQFDLGRYWRDVQTRVFLYLVIALVGIITLTLWLNGIYPDFLTSLRYASFQLISVMTTTGFLTDDFSQWPLFVPALIILSAFIGGCVGSTAGGYRVIRLIILYKQAMRGLMRMIHPNAVFSIKIEGKSVPDNVLQTVWEFTIWFIASYVILSFLLMATGVDMVSAFSGVATCFTMAGPGLGTVVYSFSGISDTGLWILSFSMLLGRLEIFPLLVLITPAFWRR
ncbi:potassium uptake protein, TrkH family [Beggiatoa alba B18LD]|uniref:Trk system potassium uptake protein n=1 Tax=Beggiatoa alba B18LD TaxID=395493 RepID=I3CCQ2_9GAMM|nr:TrkH family potassium uptake protein [Beggiatoa alba]EIJ41395.1 potassium uptake protein, TrkH family [Beggiatoa alba B18LD]